MAGKQAQITAKLHSNEVQVATGASQRLKFGEVESLMRYASLTMLAAVASKPSAKTKHTPNFFPLDKGRFASFPIGSIKVTRSRITLIADMA